MLEISSEEQDYYVQLGAKLKLQRERAKISLTSLSDRTGVSESTIQRIEAGSEGASISALLRMCSALGLRGPLDSLASKRLIEPCTPLTLESKETRDLVSTLLEELEGSISEFCAKNSPYHRDPDSLARDYMGYVRPFITNLLAGRLPSGTQKSLPLEPLVYSEDTVSRYYSKHTPLHNRAVHGWTVQVEGQQEFLCAEKLKFVPVDKITDVFSTPDFAYAALEKALPSKRGLPVSSLVIVPLQVANDVDDDADTPLWRESTEGELLELYTYFPGRHSYTLSPELE